MQKYKIVLGGNPVSFTVHPIYAKSLTLYYCILPFIWHYFRIFIFYLYICGAFVFLFTLKYYDCLTEPPLNVAKEMWTCGIVRLDLSTWAAVIPIIVPNNRSIVKPPASNVWK